MDDELTQKVVDEATQLMLDAAEESHRANVAFLTGNFVEYFDDYNARVQQSVADEWDRINAEEPDQPDPEG